MQIRPLVRRFDDLVVAWLPRLLKDELSSNLLYAVW